MSQIQRELDHLKASVDSYVNAQYLEKVSGKAHETAGGLSIIRQAVLPIGEEIERLCLRKVAGVNAHGRQVLHKSAFRVKDGESKPDFNIPAFIGLRTLLSMIYNARGMESRALGTVALQIGVRLEHDQKQHRFELEYPGYVHIVENSFDAQNVTSYDHKLRTWQKKWNQFELRWEDWGLNARTHAGMTVIRAIMNVMPDYFFTEKRRQGKHSRIFIDSSTDLDDYMIECVEDRAAMMVLVPPMIAPPMDYTVHDGRIEGGFHTPQMRHRVPFLRMDTDEHREYVRENIPRQHIDAVNKLQATPWTINRKVQELIEHVVQNGLMPEALPNIGDPIPVPEYPVDGTKEEIIDWKGQAKRIHGRNRRDRSDFVVLKRSLDEARSLDDRFWFAYNVDFRGRIYCSSVVLSPQGPDHIKAMLQFADGKELGEDGIRWTAINGANKYGYDKCSYDARVQWVHDNRGIIEEIVVNPTSSRSISFLRDADKPFQFYAFCLEWGRTDYGRNPRAVGCLPVGLDGSCNGLQHYAALLRDETGAREVNILPSEEPSDIYRAVSHEFIKLIEQSPFHDYRARFILKGVDRKLAKRPVMTLPYGATQKSCRVYIKEYITDNAADFGCVDDDRLAWKIATYATPIMWEAIKNVVLAAREGMGWLQKCAWQVAESAVYVRWRSPVEFPVYQNYAEHERVEVKTQLNGAISLILRGNQTGPASWRTRNGIAPNFVHAIDSSHMVMVINAMETDAFACIHDDFGVHAADTERFFHVIREQFNKLYQQADWIALWKAQVQTLIDGELPDPPEKGELDIAEVLDSPYFFG